ncbi:mitochondrial inner membrane protease ATP23 isoform X2 [Cryptomeria japonica]|uniref:mitochondrial inner membrane protease ATP23 isoform X2 n=1 Tax=Cryptomeria japonica TaxID=3369 RepID=UPI0025AD0C2C|nr:mitochondrial inner membrane protease ATP23 isoform X2 [Cryptomeria japonica]
MEEPPTSSASRGSTIEQTERMIDASLRIPTVKFLIEHLAKSGCSVGRDFFKAEKCGQSVSGGYQPGHGIEVCSNHVTLQDEVNQVIIHELIHAYDECRVANLDWSNCAHHACSEECVKRRVLKSVNRNPSCSEEASKEAMEAVWDICYNDTKPFDRAM